MYLPLYFVYVNLDYIVYIKLFLCLCQPDLYVNLYFVANIKIKNTMYQSLCQPDIYVHLYYVVNVEAETKVLCLC